MAVNNPQDFSPSNFKGTALSPDKYITLGDFIDEVNKPDNREDLVKTYGDQQISGIFGLLDMVGATRAEATNDEVTWWEETRLHVEVDGTLSAITAGTSTSATLTSTAHKARVGDGILIDGDIRAYVSAIPTANTITVLPYTPWKRSYSSGAAVKASVVFNEYAQSTDQPTEFIQPNVRKLTNPFMIIKDVYAVSGSQMTNFGWVKDPETGSMLWYWKGETETRKRFQDYVEMASILGEKATNSNVTTLNINGAEGLFSAIEDRGIVNSGYMTGLSDYDEVIKILDKQGGASEYVSFNNRQQQLNNDDLIADNAGGVLSAAYGTFANGKDMAVNLGFSSFSRGGYTFHNKSWKLLNEPTLLGKTERYKGVMIPMDKRVDPKTGINAPSLEKNYKAADGYSRELEHFVLGSANGGSTPSDGYDNKRFEYRSECNLITRAANRFVLIA